MSTYAHTIQIIKMTSYLLGKNRIHLAKFPTYGTHTVHCSRTGWNHTDKDAVLGPLHDITKNLLAQNNGKFKPRHNKMSLFQVNIRQ